MKVPLGKFAQSGIREHLGVDLGAVVQAALTHYTRRLSSHWQPVGAPRFMEPPQGGAEYLELAITPEVEAELEREAHRQHVTVEQITRHAVLVYLADLDAAETTADTGLVTLASFPGDQPTV